MGRNPTTGDHDPSMTDMNLIKWIKEGTFVAGELSGYGRYMYREFIGADQKQDWMCKAGYFNKSDYFLGKGIIYKE